MATITRHIEIARQHLANGNARAYRAQMESLIREGGKATQNRVRRAMAEDTAEIEKGEGR